MSPTENTVNTVATKYWHSIDERRVQCDLCPRHCKLKDGQQGLCFVREAQNGAVVLNSYGRSSGFCIDPIEKKPLNHFYPGSAVLSFGTAGCNLACKFCQNWDMSKSREMDTLASQASPEKIASAAKLHGCKSVAFTYNDPVIFLEYAVDVAKACHDVGVKSVAVTAGYIDGNASADFFPFMDAVNVDLKAFTEKFYYQITGGHLNVVLDTLQYIKHETHSWLEITTLLIPGENDSIAEIEEMTQWISENLGNDVPLHFSAFHPDWKMLNTPSTPASTLTRAREIALKAGLKHVYVGNVHDEHASSTYCESCGEKLIGRDWYVLSDWNLDANGNCSNCHKPCAGLFDPQPGTWGAKRLPISI